MSSYDEVPVEPNGPFVIVIPIFATIMFAIMVSAIVILVIILCRVRRERRCGAEEDAEGNLKTEAQVQLIFICFFICKCSVLVFLPRRFGCGALE